MSGHERRAVTAPLPVTHTSASGDFSSEAIGRREEKEIGALLAHDFLLRRDHVLDALLGRRYR